MGTTTCHSIQLSNVFNKVHPSFTETWASPAKAGLAKARGESPDLVILDVMLPKMDGNKVCRLLKFDERVRHIPIIMLSARTQQSDIELGKEVGADAYMTKPFDMNVLLAKIRELLSD